MVVDVCRHRFTVRRPRPTKQPPIDLVNLLPPLGSRRRWGARAKAAVVVAVRSGALSLSEAHDRYQLSIEELSQWEEAFDRDGIAGLQAKVLSSRDRSRERGS